MARYIDADALLEKAWDADTRIGYVQVVDVGDVIDAPTVSPDEVRGVGRWLNDVGEFGFPEIPCSVCGYKNGHYGFKYCPNCGAKMEVIEDA